MIAPFHRGLSTRRSAGRLFMAAALLAFVGCERSPDAPTAVRGQPDARPAALPLSAALGDKAGVARGANLLLVTLDTTRADRLGCYGNGQILTPAVDRLAREGLLFEQALAVAPTTLPTHSSIMTGRYPAHHTARVNGFFRLPEEETTLAEVLLAAGYRTAAVVSSFVLQNKFGVNQGFETYADRFAELEKDATEWPERRGDLTTGLALEALNRIAGERFFLWVHYYDAHHAYEPPPAFQERYAHNLYDGEIAFVDTELMRLVLELQSRKLLDSTLIVVVGDHGEGLGDHDEATHGVLTYQSLLRVPLIMRYGSQLGPARVSTRVSQVDLLPTILSLLAVKPPATLDGRDLTRQGEVIRPLFFENLNVRFNQGGAPIGGVVEEPYKYIFAVEGELYDLARDPRERKDLATSEPATTARLAARLPELFGPQLTLLREAAASVEPSAADLQRLEALGYTGGGSTEDSQELQDPRDIVRVYVELEEAAHLDYAEAIPRITAMLEASPWFAAGWRRLAEVHVSNNKLPEAAEAYDRCLKLVFMPGVAYALADLHATMGNIPKAKELLEVIVSQQPDYPQASFRLGELLALGGERDRSLQLIHDSLHVDPQFLTHLLEMFVREQRIDDLVEFMRTFLVRYPAVAPIRIALAKRLTLAGLYQDVEQIYREGLPQLRTDGAFVNAYALFLGDCPEASLRNPQQAIAMIDEYCAAVSEPDPATLLTLSSLHASVGQMRAALEVGQRGREIARARQDDKLVEALDRHLARVRSALPLSSAPSETGSP